jgi:hypothetical protein
MANEAKTFAAGYVFGAPVKDLGWLASLIMGLASGFIAFFIATFAGIVFVLFWNAAGHHADYTVRWGFPRECWWRWFRWPIWAFSG